MRIEEVSMQNYRQYVNEKGVSFSKDVTKKGHDCFVLIAENGVGKSNFLNAITWCLYGVESHLSSHSDGRPIVNVAALDKAVNAEEVTVKVSVVISAENKKYTITRTAIYKNSGRTGVLKAVKVGGSFDVYVSTSGRAERDIFKKDDEAAEIVNRIVPFNINQFFFFDNEQLENYFSEKETAVDIKQSIYDISQITLVNDVIAKLNDLSTEYTKAIGRKSPDIEVFQSDVTKAESTQVYWANAVASLNKENKSASATIQADNDYLGEAKNVQTLVDSVGILKGRQDELLEKQKSLIARKKGLITKYGIYLRLYPSLKKTEDFIKELSTQGKLPPEISVDYLKEILKQNVCLVCGQPLTPAEREKIQETINKFQYSTPSTTLLVSIQSEIERMLDECKKYPSEKAELYKEIDENEKALLKNSSDLSDAQTSLNRIGDQDKALKCANEIIKLTDLIKKNNETLGLDKAKLADANQALAEKQHALNAAIARQKMSGNTIAFKAKTDQLRDLFTASRDELVSEMRTTMAQATFTIFSDLDWKKQSFARVSIDDDYSVKLFDNREYEALGTLSKGETALLALSYTLALHQISGFEGMLVIDSPVGRLSGENRANFAQILDKISLKKQVIMLFTESEYSKEIKPIFDVDATKYKVTTVDGSDVSSISPFKE